MSNTNYQTSDQADIIINRTLDDNVIENELGWGFSRQRLSNN